MKFWRGNKLANEAEYEPLEVAIRFIREVRQGYDPSKSRVSMEFAFRWWLTDPEAFNVVWDEEDTPALMDALESAMTPEDREFIWEKIAA